MTNWYSPSIKADWEDLLKRNPDAIDILNFIVSHGDVDDIVESMRANDAIQRLIKAIHGLDDLLNSDLAAVENWRDEIVHMQDIMQELED